mgnify:CR=1 FL=1
MDTVMARARPRKRALSKNITSPSAMASHDGDGEEEEVLLPDGDEAPDPARGEHPGEEEASPRSERTALTVTELREADTVRTRRLVTAHVRAEASERTRRRGRAGR